MDKRTSLYEKHVALSGKMVMFAGFQLPVQYEAGLIAEHMAVRERCGLFDVSHMGEFLCSGKGALESLNHLLTNDFSGMYDGQARYSPMTNENGGVIDDLIVYRLDAEHFLVVVNASNKEKDFIHMKAGLKDEAKLIDISDDVAQIALQGPRSREILVKLMNEKEIPVKYYSCTKETYVNGTRCLLSRTGYTGEAGYELYMAKQDAPALWDALLDAGKEFGILPCGLGARDTLRLEAAMPLYGHEMDEGVSPLEAGLDFAVKLNKPEFIGKEALLEQKDNLTRKRVGLKAVGRGILREDEDIYIGDRIIGKTTSGTLLPYLKYAAAMALVDIDCIQPGTRVTVDVRGRLVEAEVVELPFLPKR